MDAEVAAALESDDETFGCDLDVGSDSDEDSSFVHHKWPFQASKFQVSLTAHSLE